jgi:hypothetical protein
MAIDPPPPDRPIDMPMPVDMTPPPTGCAGNAPRTAFLNPAMYRDIAGCGAAMNFNQAVQNAVTVCAPGWSLCRPDQVAASTATDPPGSSNSATCGWVARTINSASTDKVRLHDALGCAAGAASGMAATESDSGTACSLTDVLCLANPWRISVPLGIEWGQRSVFYRQCFNHLTVTCATSNCLITCCRD